MSEQAVRAARRRQAALLIAWGLIGGVSVLPYALALQADMLSKIIKPGGPNLLSLAFIGAMQTAILVFFAVLLGLAAARRTGLGAPVSWTISCGFGLAKIAPIVRRFAGRSLAVGVATGLVMVLLDLVVFLPNMPDLRAINLKALREVAVWKGALACLYGGITEEILLRLLLMSGFALVLKRLWRTNAEQLPTALLWTANALAALLFAAGHLPAAKALLPLGPLLVVRTLVLNGLAGLGFGWLYMRRGLEAAMLGHFTCDVILHVLAPAIALWAGLGR